MVYHSFEFSLLVIINKRRNLKTFMEYNRLGFSLQEEMYLYQFLILK